MSPPSFADYRTATTTLLGWIIPRPGMYFNTLHELESLLNGHSFAFTQMGLELHEPDFNRAFLGWIYKKHTPPRGGAGWSALIPEIAERQGRDARALLFECLVELLAEWAPLPEPTLAAPPTDSSEP